MIEECLVMQLRKHFDSVKVLKWIKFYISETEISERNLNKIKQDLLKIQMERPNILNDRSYNMLHKMIVGDIEQMVNY